MHTYSIKATVPMEQLGDALKALTPFVQGPPDIQVVNGEATAPRRRQQRATNPMSETKSGKAVIDGMDAGREYAVEEIGALLQTAGLSASSAGSVASQLTQEEKLERTRPGQYRKRA